MSKLDELFAKAKARVAAMTPAERAAMYEAQRQSWIRGMATPCEHGDLDWETCPECLREARSKT